MNIHRIYSVKFNTTSLISRAGSNNSQYGIRMSQPLSVDTVSFEGRGVKVLSKEIRAAAARKDARALRDARQIAEAKKAPDKAGATKKSLSGEERKQGVSISTARQIREMILKPQKQINNFMDRVFGDLVITESEPKNHILKMSGRAKSDVSIMEKSSTRDWNSISEILENMTDLNGRKIVFNYKTGKQEAENVLSRFIPLIKTGQITLLEAELQRPESIKPKSMSIKSIYNKEQEEYDYVSKAFLDKLEDAQEEVWNGTETNADKIKLVNRPVPKYTKGNYCALHLILQTTEKDSRPFELQVMGARMSDGKSFDDKRFKFFDGKELDKMYAPLTDLWKTLLPKENADAKERFLQYVKDANFQLREDEIQEHKTQRLLTRPTGLFKSVRNYGLTPEYDLNYQYKLMRDCEQKAKKEQKGEPIVQIIEEKVVEEAALIEKRLLGIAKEKVGLTKEKFQRLVAKYAPKHTKNSKSKSKLK